jgi:hypothetical protein
MNWRGRTRYNEAARQVSKHQTGLPDIRSIGANMPADRTIPPFSKSAANHREWPAEYRCWRGIKQRCYNPKVKCYERYGGRGITMCGRWLNSFENFYADVGPKPSPAHTIERRNNDLGYTPDNCYWATKAEQDRNRRSNLLVTIDGITKCLKDWCIERGLDHRRAYERWRRGKRTAEELFAPPQRDTPWVRKRAA